MVSTDLGVNLLITLLFTSLKRWVVTILFLRIRWPSHNKVFQPNSYRKVHYMDVSSGWMLSTTGRGHPQNTCFSFRRFLTPSPLPSCLCTQPLSPLAPTSVFNGFRILTEKTTFWKMYFGWKKKTPKKNDWFWLKITLKINLNFSGKEKMIINQRFSLWPPKI